MPDKTLIKPDDKLSRVLVVDDDSMMCALYQTVLSVSYQVDMAQSGQEALEFFKKHSPDLVLLDIEMPAPNGFEVCRKIRESSRVPIIFVTAHQSLDEHLKAYNAGGNDIVTKPVDIKILQHKVDLAIQSEKLQKNRRKEAPHKFLSSDGGSGILLEFMRGSLGCRTYEALAEKLLTAAREFGVECGVMIRSEKENTFLTSRGEPTSLEKSILEQSASMGREFQFKSRLVLNQDRISILVSNLPSNDSTAAKQIRDNMVILAETAEALIETVEMRRESMSRAEQMQLALGNAVAAVENLRSKSRNMMADSSLMLHDLVHEIENAYSWLDTSKQQEEAISRLMNDAVQRVLNVFASGKEAEQEFEKVLDALKGKSNDSVDDMLF